MAKHKDGEYMERTVGHYYTHYIYGHVDIEQAKKTLDSEITYPYKIVQITHIYGQKGFPESFLRYEGCSWQLYTYTYEGKRRFKLTECEISRLDGEVEHA